MASVERRPRGDGTIGWRVSWRQDGRRNSETFDSHAAARRFAGLVDAAGQRWPAGWQPGRGYREADGAGHTVRSWCELAVAARTGITTHTRVEYQRQLARHVYPALGDLPIAGLGRGDAAAWLQGLTVAPKTVHNLHGLLSGLLSDAVRSRVIEANPVAGMRLPRHDGPDRGEMVVLTPAEFDTLLEAAPDRHRLLLRFLVRTGLRWGEVTALEVRHVNPGAASVHVWQAWKPTPNGGLELGATKTARSRRTVTVVPSSLADDLAAHIAGRPAHALVFPAPKGGPLRNGTFHSRGWIPTVDAAVACEEHRRATPAGQRPAPCGCPGRLSRRPRIHDLRHTHVAWLMAAGVDPYRIQRRLGHESITTTIDRYGHLMPSDDGDLAAALSEGSDAVIVRLRDRRVGGAR